MTQPEIREVELEPTVGQHGPRTVQVHLRRSRRTRHVRLHVDESLRVTASIPQRFAASRIDPIVRERSDWLCDALARMAERAATAQIDIIGGEPVRMLGRWVPVEVIRDPARTARGTCQLTPDPASAGLESTGQTGADSHPDDWIPAGLRIAGDGLTPQPGSRLEIRVPVDGDPYEVLRSWYRREAKRVLTQRAHAWAEHLNLAVGAISIRDQRTRWGSCTHRGDLSFNWRLILAPLWILDSIVVHELCHIDELNHSDRFWALLDERYPQHGAASDWLREHGSALRMPEPRPVASPVSGPDPGAAAAPTRTRGRRRLPPPVEQFQLEI